MSKRSPGERMLGAPGCHLCAQSAIARAPLPWRTQSHPWHARCQSPPRSDCTPAGHNHHHSCLASTTIITSCHTIWLAPLHPCCFASSLLLPWIYYSNLSHTLNHAYSLVTTLFLPYLAYSKGLCQPPPPRCVPAQVPYHTILNP